MYYSRITLDLAKLPPGRLKELITKGSYALHQWVWLLFTDDETRKFLFREEEGQGFLRFYVLSENAPTKNDLFQIETKEFKPKLRKGDRLIFSLRANPTVSTGRSSGMVKKARDRSRLFPNFIKCGELSREVCVWEKRRPNHILYHGFFRSFRDL